ncbi:succinylglutamate desuccinylase/aspartoacylase family protein [Mesorhizobium sp. INR15]|uniref:succinylglutamate desuccinylase/aspartoacylase domain-containing protein n=1 Tax=Mesorhizobium sp. INR15 TaxID=2654248 RepID=UPI00189668E1|nr:succinylglutamate desuccinylase/aspartoacylase family protein [Mesorhizobium sp. INR15]
MYIQAALHADELPAVMTACHLIPLFDAAAREGQIVGEIILVTNANPVGMAQSLNTHHLGRHAFADGGGNFNRGWPDLGAIVLERFRGSFGDNAQQNIVLMRTELRNAVVALPETSEWQALQKALLTLSIDADIVFDLHCDFQAELHLFAHVEHKDMVSDLGCDMGASVVILEQSIAAGLFDECNGGPWFKVRKALKLAADLMPAACFAPTIELRGRSDVSDQFGARDAANIMNFLRRNGAVLGEAPPLPAARCEATAVSGCDMIPAPVAGMVAWHVGVGTQVVDGEHIADVIDFDSPEPLLARTPVFARQSGRLFSQRLGHLTRPGEILCQIAGKTSLVHRQNAQFLNP